MICNYKYVSPQGEEGLKRYQYQGGDASIAYKYILGPLAQWFVDNIIPETMAPNLITLLGLFCTIIPHIIIAFYSGGDLNGPVPGWASILAGVMTLMYQTLDNCDGKQARKTKNSSPLGLLFDHGCDALNTFITTLSMAAVMRFGGNSAVPIITFVLAAGPFYTATWEEYYTGGLFLPMINGASEGLIASSLIFITAGFVPSEFWLQSSPFANIKWNELLLYGMVALSVLSLFSNFLAVSQKATEKLWGAIGNLAPMLFLLLTISVTHFFGVDVDEAGYYSVMRFKVYFFGLHFAKLMTHMQMAHVADEEFKGFRKTTTVLFIAYMGITLFQWFNKDKPLIPHELVIYPLLGVSVIIYAHLAVNTIQQFTKVLNIKAFSIKRQERQHLFN